MYINVMLYPLSILPVYTRIYLYTKNPQPQTTLGLRSNASCLQESCGVPVSKAWGVVEAVSSCLSFPGLNSFQIWSSWKTDRNQKKQKTHILLSLTIFRFANFRRISDLVLHYAFSLKAPLQAVATLGPEESRCGCWKFLVVRHV